MFESSMQANGYLVTWLDKPEPPSEDEETAPPTEEEEMVPVDTKHFVTLRYALNRPLLCILSDTQASFVRCTGLF